MKIPTLFDVTLVGRFNQLDPIIGKDYVIFVWEDFFSVLYFASEFVDHLVVRSVMYRPLEDQHRFELSQEVSRWNTKNYDPTATITTNDGFSSNIEFRTSLPIATGVTKHQLTAAIAQACDAAHSAADFFLKRFPELGRICTLSERIARAQQRATILTAHSDPTPERPARLIEEARLMEHLMSTEDEILEGISLVTQVRIKHMLAGLGPSSLSLRAEGNSVMVSLCNVLFNISVTAGPALILRGHWISKSDPNKDFIRVFTLCNDWNRGAHSTDAYCSTKHREFIVVNVEYTIPMTRGLSDAQLAQALRVGISNILSCVDKLSTTADGTSVVHWAE